MGGIRQTLETQVTFPKDPTEMIILLKSILDKKEEASPVIPIELIAYAAKAVDKEGCTPLHIAAKEGRGDIVTLLIDNQANVNSKWSKYESKNSDVLPIHLAILNNHYEVVLTLLKKNPYLVNKKMRFNAQELKEYAKRNKNDPFHSLFDAQSSSVKDFTGLYLAAYLDNAPILLMLLTHAEQSDLEIQAFNGSRIKVKDLAKSMGHSDIAQILEYYSVIIAKADFTFKKSIDLRINHMLESRGEKASINEIIKFLHETAERINAVKDKLEESEKLEESKESEQSEESEESDESDESEKLEELEESDESNYHKVLIYLINKKYPAVDSKEGVCQGLAINAMLTMMQSTEEVNKFNDRQKLIYSYFEDCYIKATDEDNLNQLLDAALKKLDEDTRNIRNIVVKMQSGLLEKRELTKEEWALLEIPAFLETTAIAFAPQNFPELYPTSALITIQDPNAAISVMSPMVLDTKLDEKSSSEVISPVPTVASISGIYTKDQLESFLQNLVSNKALIELGEPLGFNFYNGEHAISAMMNPKTAEFYFYDANGGVIKNVTLKMMADKIFQALNNTKTIGVFTDIFSKKSNSYLAKEILHNWKNSDEFALLHSNTARAIQLRDDNTLASSLYLATIAKDFTKVALLLAKGADPNAATKQGHTPLYIAVQNRNIELVKLLVNNNADPNFININKDTPLHMAVTKNDLELCELLIKNKANTNLPNINGNTPLHMAVIKSNLEMCELLINNKAGTNFINTNGYTPLHMAVGQENLELCELLIKNKADTNLISSTGYSPLMIAAETGNIAIIKLLLANKADPYHATKNLILPLHSAVQNNHIDAVHLLIDSKMIHAKFDASYAVLMRWADKNAKLDEFKQLFLSEDKPILGFTPLHLAAFFGHKEMVELLINKGADINMFAEQAGTYANALQIAKAMGHEDIVNILIAKQQDFSESTKEEKILTSHASAPPIDDLQNELHIELTRINSWLKSITKENTKDDRERVQIDKLCQFISKTLKEIDSGKPADIDSLKKEINLRKDILEHIHRAKSKFAFLFKPTPSPALKLITNLDELMKHISVLSPLNFKK